MEKINNDKFIVEIPRESFADKANVNGFIYEKNNYDEKMKSYINSGGKIYWCNNIEEVYKFKADRDITYVIGQALDFNDRYIICEIYNSKFPNFNKSHSKIFMTYKIDDNKTKNNIVYIEEIQYLDLFVM